MDKEIKSNTWLRKVFQEAMEEKGFEQYQELADYFGVSRQVLQNWIARNRLSKQATYKVSTLLGEKFPVQRIMGIGEWFEERKAYERG